MGNRDREWDFHLRTLSNSARDSSVAKDPPSDPSLLQPVKKLNELCKAENSEDLVARVYRQINKLFQHGVASLSQSRTSNGLLLLKPIMDRLGEAYDSPAKLVSSLRVENYFCRKTFHLGLREQLLQSLLHITVNYCQGHARNPGTANWGVGGTKMIAYILGEQDILRRR